MVNGRIWSRRVLNKSSNSSSKILHLKEKYGCLLLMSAQTGFWQCDARRTAERLIEVYDSVVARGHQMRFLTPFPGRIHALEREIMANLNESRPCAVLFIETKNKETDYFLRWPKDGIQSYRDFVAISAATPCRRLANALGFVNATVSPWCEGGLIARAGKTLIVSSAAPSEMKAAPPADGFTVRVLPEPLLAAECGSHRYHSSSGKSHIDLDLSIVCSVHRKTIVLASESYHEMNSDALLSLVDLLEAELFVVPHDEALRRVINCIYLPPDDLIIPSDCPSTELFLRNHFGDNLIVVSIDDDFNFNGGDGGLGCMTSVLNGRKR